MDVTPELVEHIADLSRLELGPEEVRGIAAELERVLGYMDVLNRLDTEGVEPMSHVFPVKNVLREDVVVPFPFQDWVGLLAGAPETDGETFLAPKTVD